MSVEFSAAERKGHRNYRDIPKSEVAADGCSIGNGYAAEMDLIVEANTALKLLLPVASKKDPQVTNMKIFFLGGHPFSFSHAFIWL